MATIAEIMYTLKNLTNAKVTQAEIARALNITSATVNIRVKKQSQLSLEELKKISKYYDVNLLHIQIKQTSNKNQNIKYAERIKKIRSVLDFSQTKLSNEINIPENTIISYEEGNIPNCDFLANLYKSLNINPIWFLSGEGEMFIKNKYLNIRDEIKQTVKDMIKLGELEKDKLI